MRPTAPRRSACATTSCPLPSPVEGFGKALARMFAGTKSDITEENIQSRVRGTALMAISNKFGAMVLTTGNKSEMSVGYATLYGDMNGGFNPIKDLYKMEVYALARWRNAHVPKGGKGPPGIVIPENILTRPPTAELRENQKDEDSLPPYEVLDDILKCLVEDEMPLGGDRRARAPGRDGEEGGADALHRRVQATAGGAGRQDLGAQLRPRPPLSHHQQVPRAGLTEVSRAGCVVGGRCAPARLRRWAADPRRRPSPGHITGRMAMSLILPFRPVTAPSGVAAPEVRSTLNS